MKGDDNPIAKPKEVPERSRRRFLSKAKEVPEGSRRRYSSFENQHTTIILYSFRKKICIDPCHRSIACHTRCRVNDAVSAQPRKTVVMKATFLYENQMAITQSCAFRKKICIDPCQRSIFAAERWQSGRLRQS